MFYNKRKTIGVFLNRAELEFQQVLSRSLTETAKQCDYNIDFPDFIWNPGNRDNV
ncbi:MAG: hypothetical protein V8Q25_04535 [Roseburia faecis]